MPDQLEAAHLRHPKVGDHEIEGPRLEVLQCVADPDRGPHRVALGLEVPPQHLTGALGVVHHQDALRSMAFAHFSLLL